MTLSAFDILWLNGIDCTQLAYRRPTVSRDARTLNPRGAPVPRFEFDDAEDLLDACTRLKQEGIVLKKLDARYVPGVRSDVWRKVKPTDWRRDHAPRRLPKEIRERIVTAQLTTMTSSTTNPG